MFLENNKWEEVKFANKGPSPRFCHSVSLWKHYLYVFGGHNGKQGFDELWRFDLDTSFWTKLNPTGDIPTARFHHSACVYKNKLIVNSKFYNFFS